MSSPRVSGFWCWMLIWLQCVTACSCVLSFAAFAAIARTASAVEPDREQQASVGRPSYIPEPQPSDAREPGSVP